MVLTEINFKISNFLDLFIFLFQKVHPPGSNIETKINRREKANFPHYSIKEKIPMFVTMRRRVNRRLIYENKIFKKNEKLLRI